MSRQDLELVERALQAWNRGDVDGFAGHLSEDVVWHEVSGRPEAEGREQVGRERLRQSLHTLFEAWESYRLDVERIQDAGDRIVAVVREVARGRTSGVEIDSQWGYLLTVEDGQIVRVEAHRDPDAALRAAGLRDSEDAA